MNISLITTASITALTRVRILTLEDAVQKWQDLERGKIRGVGQNTIKAIKRYVAKPVNELDPEFVESEVKACAERLESQFPEQSANDLVITARMSVAVGWRRITAAG